MIQTYRISFKNYAIRNDDDEILFDATMQKFSEDLKSYIERGGRRGRMAAEKKPTDPKIIAAVQAFFKDKTGSEFYGYDELASFVAKKTKFAGSFEDAIELKKEVQRYVSDNLRKVDKETGEVTEGIYEGRKGIGGGVRVYKAVESADDDFPAEERSSLIRELDPEVAHEKVKRRAI